MYMYMMMHDTNLPAGAADRKRNACPVEHQSPRSGDIGIGSARTSDENGAFSCTRSLPPNYGSGVVIDGLPTVSASPPAATPENALLPLPQRVLLGVGTPSEAEQPTQHRGKAQPHFRRCPSIHLSHLGRAAGPLPPLPFPSFSFSNISVARRPGFFASTSTPLGIRTGQQRRRWSGFIGGRGRPLRTSRRRRRR